MKGIIALALAGLILYGVPALAVEAGVEGLRLNEDEGGPYLGVHRGASRGDAMPDFLNDMNYIWPDVRDGRAEIDVETSPEADLETAK